MRKWKELKQQVLAGTKLDAQGETATKEFLISLCESSNKKGKIPLGQHHDMSKDSVGYIENFNVVPDSNDEAHWTLVGDVYFHDIDLDEALKGFSYSITEDLVGDLNNKKIAIYIPYPHYNDDDLLEALAEENSGVVAGSWRKKSADPDTVSLLISLVLFVAAPAFTNYWNEKITPAYKKFREKLGKKSNLDFVQVSKGHRDETFGIYFIPSRSDEDSCFTMSNVLAGIEWVNAYVKNDSLAKEKGVSLVKMQFSEAKNCFEFRTIEYLDGSVINNQC